MSNGLVEEFSFSVQCGLSCSHFVNLFLRVSVGSLWSDLAGDDEMAPVTMGLYSYRLTHWGGHVSCGVWYGEWIYSL